MSRNKIASVAQKLGLDLMNDDDVEAFGAEIADAIPDRKVIPLMRGLHGVEHEFGDSKIAFILKKAIDELESL
jgi:hypothetical protein